MRLCNRCKKAENPLGKLTFVDSPEGTLCSGCYERFYAGFSTPAADALGSELVVIICPECRGKHHAPKGKECSTCKGYGAVRIASKHLAKYIPGDNNDDDDGQ